MNPTTKGRGIAHWVGVFANFDRANHPSVVERNNPQRQAPRPPLISRVKAELLGGERTG